MRLSTAGAIAGAGKSMSDAAQMIQQEWLQDRQTQQILDREDRSNREWDRREDTRHKNDESLIKTRENVKGDDYDAGGTWTSGGNTFMKDLSGKTWLLDPDSRSWVPISAPGENPTGLSQEELMKAAEDYADQRVKESAGWFSLDEKDFKDYGGSRTKAREAFKQEYLDQQGASLNTPPTVTPPESPSGSSASTTKSPGMPEGQGTQQSPYMATTQENINWFRENAAPGTIIVVDGTKYTK